MDGYETRSLSLYADGRYTRRLSAYRVRSVPSQTTLAALVERGYVTVKDDDLARGEITVTDAGRNYLATHEGGH